MRGRAAPLAAWFMIAAACDRREGAGAAASISASGSPSAPSTAAPVRAIASTPAEATSAAPDVASARAAAGGPWVTCYGRFRPTSTPLRDVLRLALLCGPANGMRQMGPVIEGDVKQGEPPRSHPLVLERGQCVRAFGVGDEGVVDLDLSLRSPSGERLASDGIDDRWPILQPDRAVCVFEAGTFTLEVSARKGSGHYAAQAWLLP